MFYNFSLDDQVDNQPDNHSTGACSLLGPDVSQTLSSKVPVNKGTTEDLPDVMEPGVMRIPPYSPERISQSWGTSERNSTGIHLLKTLSGRDFCGISTFIDQTSGALPSVEDCLTIVRNIQGDDSSSWQTPVVGKPHRGILEYKSCVFGVEATKVNGNVWFLVGGQDVIDIINESIARFKQNGKVGAMGTMKCMGNLLDQWVEWGLY
ncbi:hypothetical protein AJ79_10115 [Helicocarpus griseus UAMH5409]|uniref:Ecp2 effector protein-like domain-containing protein n=1 Tax=Helicocarpus griseus UAMH5409 TaxID=1447875 RepID=A0A2B7WF69_9EURO|nr:hypothetical protein AJ79_10115 [Helicocarpus griseus UAMH5409]